jgi:hypothetical protein
LAVMFAAVAGATDTAKTARSATNVRTAAW